jgi:glucosamine 6-phosphate synthetase-like amidotransferase/phosphosugar isomerase protein
MCGINGMVFLNGVKRDEEMLKAIRFIFDEVLVETQDRGHHATGIAHFRRDGLFYETHKSAVSADMFVTFDETYESIANNFSDDTSVVISHTRYYTKGKPDNNNNNHPFDIGNVVGVHNGTVANDDDLFKKFESNFTRNAEVDSEIIYQLINFYNQNEITYEGLKEALEKSLIRGGFALAFTHKNQSNLLHIVKQERPMDIFYWKEAGVIIYNSDKKYIRNSFARAARVGKRFGIHIVGTLEEFKLPADRYITIDANADSFEKAVSEPQKLFLSSSAVRNNYNYSSYNSAGSCGSAGNAGCGSGTTTRVAASDSIGRIIEGELDTISGEVIIFTQARIDTVGDDDDGAGLDSDETVYCMECENPLQEHEVHASYNEGAADTESYYCSACHQQALTGVFAG